MDVGRWGCKRNPDVKYRKFSQDSENERVAENGIEMRYGKNAFEIRSDAVPFGLMSGCLLILVNLRLDTPAGMVVFGFAMNGFFVLKLFLAGCPVNFPANRAGCMAWGFSGNGGRRM
jgi:hypothetical protein